MWNIRKIIRTFYSEHLGLISIAFFSGIFVSVLQIMIPLSIGRLYEMVFHESSSKGMLMDRLGIHLSNLHSFFIFFFVLVAARGIFGFIERYSYGLTGEAFLLYLRSLLFKGQLGLNYQQFNEKGASKHFLKYTSDLKSSQDFLIKGFLGFTGDIIFLLLALAVLFSLNASLSVIVMMMVPIAFVINYAISRWSVKFTLERNNVRSSLLDFTSQRLSSFLTIKALNRESPEMERFTKRARRVFDEGRKVQMASGFIESLLPLMFYLMIGLVLLKASTDESLSNDGSFLLVFILLLLYMQRVLKRVLRVPFILRQGRHSLNGLMEVLNKSFDDKREVTGTKQTEGKIRLEEVLIKPATDIYPALTFSMETLGPGLYVIQTVNEKWRASLTRQFLALEMPESGRFILDGDAYSSMSRSEVRKKIAIISRQVPLLGSTIFEAISYGRGEERKLEVLDFLKKSGIRIGENNDDALQTRIEASCSNLSLNEQMKLQFVRAKLTKKKILVIEEPFAGLDRIVRNELISLIHTWRTKQTIIYISSVIPEGMLTDQIYYL